MFAKLPPNSEPLNNGQVFKEPKVSAIQRFHCITISKITYIRFWDKAKHYVCKSVEQQRNGIDPWGTPQTTSHKPNKPKPIFVNCFRLLR